MFQNGTNIFYAFVACILFGIAKSQDNPESVSPHDIADLRQQLYIQDGNLNGKLAFMGDIQKKTLEKLDTIEKEISANRDTTQNVGRWVPMDTPNQCGAFCLAALSPLFDHNDKVEEQLNILTVLIKENRESQRELQENIKSIQKEYQEKLDKSQQENQEKLDGNQQENQEKLDRIQQEVQQNLDSIKIETKKLIEAKTQKEPEQETQAPEPTYIPPGFRRVGSRYFYIENNIKINWTLAEESCRKMGGHLAAFRNQKEIDDLGPYVRRNYWLGINDREVKGQCISVASGKPAPFLNFASFAINRQGCATIFLGKMFKGDCNSRTNFICQLDDKV